MVKDFAAPVARDLCVAEMACQAECPVNPPAVVVVNTKQAVTPRIAPWQDDRHMTNVTGCYVIGEVSGLAMVKNAAREGAEVIEYIADELGNLPPEPRADFDVAIVGVGPAGLSAAVTAKQHGLRYVAIEQDKVVSKIEGYPKNKYVFFKPTGAPYGPLPLAGKGDLRENVLTSWRAVIRSSGVDINDGESCQAVEPSEGGKYFTVRTKKVNGPEHPTYLARRVVLALGKSGAPRKLPAKNADMTVTRDGRVEKRVLDKLSDRESFKRKRVAVVGGGNSAVEAAIALVAQRPDDDTIKYLPPEEINEVSLIVRSHFNKDLKFANKMLIYRCIDEGKVKAYFHTVVKEVCADEVVLKDARTGKLMGTIANDYVIPLIGGDYPFEFLDSIGIKIPDWKAKKRESAMPDDESDCGAPRALAPAAPR